MRNKSVLAFLLAISVAAIGFSCGDDDEGGSKKAPAGAGGGGGSGDGGSGGSGGSGGEGGTGGHEVPATINVSGEVIDGDGEPILGAFVFLNEDYEDNLVTDSDGKFSATEVEAPYTLTVVNGSFVLHLVGLDNPAPIVVGTEAGKVKRVVQLPGQTNIETPIPAGRRIYCSVEGAHVCDVEVDLGTGEFIARLELYEDLDREKGDVHFVYAEPVNDQLRNYHNSTVVTDVDFPAGLDQDPLEANFSDHILGFDATVNVGYGAYGHMTSGKMLSFMVDGSTVRKPHGFPLANVFNVPSDGATLQVVGQHTSGAKVYVHFPAKNGVTQIDLPEKPAMQIVRPKKDATVSATPTLEWTRVDDARSYLLRLKHASASYVIAVPADRTSFKLPDLSEYGIDHSGEYSGDVTSVPPEVDLDPADLGRAGLGTYRLDALEDGTYYSDSFGFEVE